MKKILKHSEDKIAIPTKLYSGLVRSLAWKIEYQDRVERALEFIDCLDSLDSDQFYYLEKILKGE